MKELIESVKVYLQDIDWSEERLVISNETILASKVDALKEKYYPDAYIPVKPWRKLTSREQITVYSKEAIADYNYCVSIIKIPKEILALFPFNETTKTKEMLSQNIAQSDFIQGIERLTEYLKSKYTEVEILPYGFSISEPGLLTTSKLSNEGRYIGLHLDNWDKLPIEKRNIATNRISVNLSSEARSFLFINLTAQQMYDKLNDNSADKTKYDDGRLVGDAFMDCYPDYPVLKCKLYPGEAYIAPTENLIHDGCTEEMKNADLTFIARGHFYNRLNCL